VVDFLARLDGIDFRQTAPVRQGTPFIYPYGDEWLASERVLTQPLPGIKPTMIARAGGLDQGNIILNLADAELRGLSECILFLAGPEAGCRGDAAGAGSASRWRTAGDWCGRTSLCAHGARGAEGVEGAA
jgi:hypothetical protein